MKRPTTLVCAYIIGSQAISPFLEHVYAVCIFLSRGMKSRDIFESDRGLRNERVPGVIAAPRKPHNEINYGPTATRLRSHRFRPRRFD